MGIASMRQLCHVLLWLILIAGPSAIIRGQQLEPRNLTNLPRGINFLTAGYTYTSGNTLLDPSIPLEDFNGNIHILTAAFTRSVNFWGKSGRIGMIIPFAGGDFVGNFGGEPFVDSYTGFGDIRLRASVNLTGAPSLLPQEFPGYQQTTISGFSVQITVPTGNYRPEQLPNLGSNRWAFRFNYGVSHVVKKWIFELEAGIWFFTANDEFLETFRLTQTPLWVAKSNIIRTIGEKGSWMAFALGYGYGARTSIDGVERDAILSQMPLGLIYAQQLGKNHTVKLVVASSIRFEQGGDFDAFGISYQYRWLDKRFRPKNP
jgi:hypothetical protein